MRQLNQFKLLKCAIAISLTTAAVFSGMAQAQEMGRVISSTPLVQPNQSSPVGYNVVYEYLGKQYQVQLQNDPGKFVQMQITPVGANQASQYAQVQPIQPALITAPQPQVVYAAAPQTVVYAQPSYYYPPYAPYYYSGIYPSLNIGLGFGFGGYRGGYGGYGGHWR